MIGRNQNTDLDNGGLTDFQDEGELVQKTMHQRDQDNLTHWVNQCILGLFILGNRSNLNPGDLSTWAQAKKGLSYRLSMKT
jgi:hypothetical protein